MKLYHFPISPNSRKVIALLHHFGLACELEAVDLTKGEQMKPSFLKLNPNHMIPVLVDGDFVLWESNAILQYLCSKVPGNSLWPSDNPALQADISRWQFWQTGHFGSACGIFIFERVIKKALNMGEPDPAEIAKGEERFNRFAQVLNNHLNGREWMVGNDLSLADFSLGSLMELAEMAEYPLKPYAEIPRWYQNVQQLPAWQSSASQTL
jgi:glutathione S-transferase